MNPLEKPPAAAGRLYFIDNLRTLLITLVIMVHLSVTYGGEGSWYYREGRADMLTGAILSLHNAVAQSFFMGLLFLFAAYFTVASYDRKGPIRFLLDRFLRLGIPLLCFEFVINPLLLCALWKMGVMTLSGSPWEFLASYYTTFHIGSGPLWFVEVLLIFSMFYAAARLVWKRPAEQRDEQGRVPSLKMILIIGTALGVLTAIVRLWFPVNWAFGPLNLQLCFFVQYLAMLIVGLTAYRRNWLRRLPRSMAVPSLAVACTLVVVGFPLLFVLGGAVTGDVHRFLGGPYWQAVAYAMWDQLLGVVMMVLLLLLFRERFNRQGRLAREASASSYTVYIIHAPIVILFALAVRNIHVYPLLKFALAVLVTVPMCFALAAGIRRLPLARRIL